MVSLFFRSPINSLPSLSPKLYSAVLFVSSFLSSGVQKVFAQEPGFGGPIPDIGGVAPGTSVREPIVNVLTFFLGFLALLAIIFIVIGGVRIIASGGNEEQLTKGRKTIIYAAIGLLVIVLARLIVGFFTIELPGEFDSA
jgi:hypothetical protein